MSCKSSMKTFSKISSGEVLSNKNYTRKKHPQARAMNVAYIPCTSPSELGSHLGQYPLHPRHEVLLLHHPTPACSLTCAAQNWLVSGKADTLYTPHGASSVLMNITLKDCFKLVAALQKVTFKASHTTDNNPSCHHKSIYMEFWLGK